MFEFDTVLPPDSSHRSRHSTEPPSEQALLPLPPSSHPGPDPPLSAAAWEGDDKADKVKVGHLDETPIVRPLVPQPD